MADGPGKTLDEIAAQKMKLHPLFVLGVTEKWEVGVYWQNTQLQNSLRSRLSVADLSHMKDGIINAIRQSLDKHLPTEFIIK